MFEPHLTPAQLAARLGCSPATLARWRCEGTGPVFIKPGGTAKQAHVRYRLADVLRWEDGVAHENTGRAA